MKPVMNMKDRWGEDRADGGDGSVTSCRRRYNFTVVAWILALAVLLGILNNLRVAGERKVAWFDSPADRFDLETVEEAMP
ncbi:MAG: hypothetical protein J6U40_08605 [Kiritimatiellae bacterium]|nr:hypothetical protein [Kiritimatiellia bacterium]MBP5225785.1 hypothetical protein [Kiritimatiellia bacterium]